MYLPWPARQMLDSHRRRRKLRVAYHAVNARSDALVHVKMALRRARRFTDGDAGPAYDAIDRRYHDLMRRTDKIQVVNEQKILGEHVGNTSTGRPWGDFLYQLTRCLKPAAALELGTCVGLSGSFIAAAMQHNGRGHLWTLEGVPDSAKVARETFSVLGLSERVTVVDGWFKDTLEPTLKEHGPFQLVFLDGDHSYEPTMAFWKTIRPHMAANGIFIFDDVSWSRGMEQAWEEVSADTTIRDAVKLMDVGIVAIN